MRIGVVTHNYPLYKGQSKDAGNFIYHFVYKLSAKVDEVFVFCPSYNGKKEEYKKVKVTWFNWLGGNKKLGNSKWWNPLDLLLTLDLLFSGQKEIVKFVKGNKIDLCLCFWNFPGGVFALKAKKDLNIPYVTWALGSDIYVYGKFPIIKLVVKLVLRNANKVFGNSLDICNEIESLSGVKAEFLPTANSLKLSTSKKVNLPKDKFNFIFLGRLELVKGPDILIDAVKVLSKNRTDFTVTMIGYGSMYDQLKKRLVDEKLREIVSLLGYVEDQDLVNGYLLNSDSLVVPSRSESFPLVITEALQANLPVIGSSVGDMTLFIPQHKLGYVFKKENSLELAKAMDRMINNGREIKKNNSRGTKSLARDFELDVIVSNFISSINDLNIK